jgi:tight adherence protein B
MSPALGRLALEAAGSALVVLGVALVVLTVVRGETVLSLHLARYRAHLERSLRLLFLPDVVGSILLGQAIAIVMSVVAVIWLGEPLLLGVGVVAAIGPTVHLQRKRKEHVAGLEGQTDALIMGLANALKTVPSPVAAFAQAAEILPNPMRLEVDRLLRELRVGTTLEQAIVNMSARAKSPDLDTALSSVLIGLQVGGNLPQVLESCAAAIREMNRLQGVVRTKTAEGRAQLWVLGVFPFAICFALLCVDRDYFQPMQTTIVGSICVTLAVTFWFASLLTARKIMKVDI